MGDFDERHSMERMMGIRGPSKKQQANKIYNRQHKKLSDEEVAAIGSRLGEADAEGEVKGKRRAGRRARVGSIFDQVVAASGVGG